MAAGRPYRRGARTPGNVLAAIGTRGRSYRAVQLLHSTTVA